MSSLAITGHQAHLMARGAAYAQRECPQAVNRQVEPQQATCAACAACAAAAAAATRAASADEVMKERGLICRVSLGLEFREGHEGARAGHH